MLNKKTKLFKGYIEDNNKIIIKIKINSLLSEKILIPNEQRIRDKDKVDEIIKYQDAYYKKGHNHFNFIGTINIHCCEEDEKNYLVDGQHRYKAMELLFKQYNYNDFYVKIEMVIVKTRNDLKENYNLINKNTELPEFPEDTNKDVVENVAKYFFDAYPDSWTLKKRNIRPNLNKNQFQEGLAFLHSKITTSLKWDMDEEDLKKILLQKNEEMSLWTVEGYSKQIRRIKKWPEFLNICKSKNMYIGMYNYLNEEYCYDWVRDIIEQLTGEHLKKEKKQRKKRIPKNKRNEVWKTYNGNNMGANCFCCSLVNLNALGSWECGHVNSEASGGDLSIQNLRPICSGCNKSMGTKNMFDYMNDFYPNNKIIKEKKKENKIITENKSKKYRFLGMF